MTQELLPPDISRTFIPRYNTCELRTLESLEKLLQPVDVPVYKEYMRLLRSRDGRRVINNRLIEAEYEGVKFYISDQTENLGLSLKYHPGRSVFNPQYGLDKRSEEFIQKVRNGAPIETPSSGNMAIVMAIEGQKNRADIINVVLNRSSIFKKLAMANYGCTIIEVVGNHADIVRGACDYLAENQTVLEQIINRKLQEKPVVFKQHEFGMNAYSYRGVGEWIRKKLSPDYFLQMPGTGGSFGIVEPLKEENPKLKAINVQPEEEIYPFDGARRHANEGMTQLFDARGKILVDETIHVTNYEAFEAARFLASQGLYFGPTTWGNVAAVGKLADIEKRRGIDIGDKIIVIMGNDHIVSYSQTEGVRQIFSDYFGNL